MATPKKRSNGVWGIQIKINGIRESASFGSKTEARLWAERRTRELKAEHDGKAGETRTLRDALRRYAEEVAPTHKGERWEIVRLAMFENEANLPVTLPLSKLRTEHLNQWKQSRLKTVSSGSVLREMSLLGSVLSHARRDWGWMTHSPLSDVRRPPPPKHRERTFTWSEIKALLRRLNHRRGRPLGMKQIVACAFLMALRTGMRAGEIAGLEWQHVHSTSQGSWVELPQTKNGQSRNVPLHAKALKLVQRLKGLDEDRCFPLTSASLDALFRKARDQAGIEGVRFHDARHTAATRIGRTIGQPGKLSFTEFCSVMGWRDPRHAMIYCNPSAAELASKL